MLNEFIMTLLISSVIYVYTVGQGLLFNLNFFREIFFIFENNQLEIHFHWFWCNSIILSYFQGLQRGMRFKYPEKKVTDNWVDQQANLDCVFEE